MARGEVQKPLPRPWRTSYYAPAASSPVGILSPNNVSPRANAHPYSPQPGAASTPTYGKRRIRLSLIPTLTQQDRSRPKVAPVPLMDAAAAVRHQSHSQSGVASIPTNTPYSNASAGTPHPPSSSVFSAAPQFFSSTPFSPVSSPEAVEEIVRHKGNKWKMLGNLFTRKPSMLFPSPTEVSPTAPAAYTMSAQPERQQFSPASRQPHRRNSSRSLDLPRNGDGDARQSSVPFPHRVQKSRSRRESLRRPPPPPAKDKPVPPIPKDEDEDDKGPPVPPKIPTEIPAATLDRYSVMFSSVLNPRESTLMARRQAQVERLNLQNPNEARASMVKKRQSSLPVNSMSTTATREEPAARLKETQVAGPVRRATLPSPTYSPSYSLFPSPNIRGSPAPRIQSPKPFQRSWTSPALSPGQIMQPSPLSTAPARKLSQLSAMDPAPPRPQSRQAEGPLDHLMRKAAERPIDKNGEKPKGKRVPWPIEIPSRKSVDPSARKPIEKPPPKPVEKDHSPPPAEADKSPPALDKPMPELPVEKSDGPVPPTIVEEDEEPEVSPLTESPSTPEHERWEPKISPRPNRSFSLGDQETDPRDQAADAVMQIAAETQQPDSSAEARKESLEADSRPFSTFAQGSPAKPSPLSSRPDRVSSLATRASALKDQASAINDWKLSLNKPLPVPSADQATSPGLAPRKQSAPVVPQRSYDDDIDWHVVSPRKASLPAARLSAAQQTSSQRQSAMTSKGSHRPSLAVRPPPRTSRAMPPRVKYGRNSAALVAATYNLPAPSPISGRSSPASNTASPTTASPHGPMPNPLASAPTTAAEISIARQISISRQQQMMMAPVAKNVAPPQQPQVVMAEGRRPSLDSATAPWNERYAARQSHHVMLEMA